jgi:ubiquinone/menaquinone biosynthesis C-methylase UbiE
MIFRSPTNEADTRKEQERQFHDRVVADAGRHSASKYYAITEFSQSCFLNHARALPGTVLDYGCGASGFVVALAPSLKHVIAVDISEVSIQKAAARVERLGLPNIEFRVGDCEALPIEDHSVDSAYGVAILHHLDLARAFAELVRVLKPGGRAVFAEPLGHNPVINLYRRLTPKSRTPDEHPLTTSDIALAKRYFQTVHVEPFCLGSLLAIPFISTPLFRPLLKGLTLADERVFRLLPSARKYAWTCVITLQLPTADGERATGPLR